MLSPSGLETVSSEDIATDCPSWTEKFVPLTLAETGAWPNPAALSTSMSKLVRLIVWGVIGTESASLVRFVKSV